MITVNDALNRAALAAVVAMSAPLNGAKVHLFTSGPDPFSGTMAPGDFTEATFDGYAAASVTWGSPYTDGQGTGYVDSFITVPQTGSTTPQTLQGYYVTDTAGTNVLFAERFPTPVLMYGLGAVCEFVLRFDMARNPGASCEQVL